MDRNQVIKLCVTTFLVGHFEAAIISWYGYRKQNKKYQDALAIRAMQVNAMGKFIEEMGDNETPAYAAIEKFNEAKEFIDLIIEDYKGDNHG